MLIPGTRLVNPKSKIEVANNKGASVQLSYDHVVSMALQADVQSMRNFLDILLPGKKYNSKCGAACKPSKAGSEAHTDQSCPWHIEC